MKTIIIFLTLIFINFSSAHCEEQIESIHIGNGWLIAYETPDLKVISLSYLQGVLSGIQIERIIFMIDDQSGDWSKILSTLKKVGDGLTGPYCKPDEVDVIQIGEIVAKYLNDNPNMVYELSSGLIREAMIEAFPCKNY